MCSCICSAKWQKEVCWINNYNKNMKCPHCGGEHHDAANFCPKTGKKISSNFMSCTNPTCRADNIPASFVFCPYCGAPMGQSPSGEDSGYEDLNLSAALGEGGADLENPLRRFVMPVDDVFNITGRGVVVTGSIAAGTVRFGDTMELLGGGQVYCVEVIGIECYRKLIDEAHQGDSVGLLLKGVKYHDVIRGSVLAECGFLRNCSSFEAQIYMFAESEGGRSDRTGVDYRAGIYIRNMEVVGNIVPAITAWNGVGPGENAGVLVKMTYPVVVREGTRFAIRENDKTVGAGIVTCLK